MATRIQENFPLQRLDIFSHPTQDDYERAKDKARQLLRQILPEPAWSELEDKGVIQIAGKRGNYVISPYSQTEIRDNSSGRCVAYACLQLSIPAPTYDRMVAEYLLSQRKRVWHRHTLSYRLRHRSLRQFVIGSSDGTLADLPVR